VVYEENIYPSNEFIPYIYDSSLSFNENNINSNHDNDSNSSSVSSLNNSNNNIQNNFISKKRKKHESYNIKRKLLGHYFKFLYKVMNVINRFIFIEEQDKQKITFLELNYNRTNKLNKKIFDYIKRKKTIKEVFLEYSNNKDKNSKKKNEDVMKYIISKNNKVINNILNKLCFEFFSNYYNNERTIELSKYDMNIKSSIILDSKIELYEDLLKANISNDKDEDELYYQNMEKTIQEYYLEKRPYFIVN
jgi:galactokinase/mevalonate kinase-like predicted kinase